MIKATFLTQLQRSIAMLDDEEQKDILDEYAQHIDMKVAGGMTESEAIEDFGPFDDLIAEILSAYHVKVPVADAASPDAAAKPASALAGLAESAGAAGKAAGRAVENAASKAVTATKNGVRKATSAVSGGIGKATAKANAAKARRAAKMGNPLAGAAGLDPAMGTDPDAAFAAGAAFAPGVVQESLFSRLRRTVKRMLTWCWKTICTLVRWTWNAMAACFAALFLGLGLFCLATTGFSVVLLLQGYPMVGASVALLGATVFMLSASYLLTRLIVRKKPADGSTCAPDETGLSGNAGAPDATVGNAAFATQSTAVLNGDPLQTAGPSGTQPLPFGRAFSPAEQPRRVFEGMVAPFDRTMGAIHE